MSKDFLSQEEVDDLLKGVSGEADEAKEEQDTSGVRPYNLATQERIVRVKEQLATQHASFEALAPGDYLRAVRAVDALAVAASTPVPAAEFDRAFAAAQTAIGVLAGQ